MKTAVVTTTINVPKVLDLYNAYATDNISFFIAGDLKTPPEARVLYSELFSDHMYYFTPAHQKRWRSSEIIGWNNDSRRNFAVLEALQWGAELIISIDDDMIPYSGFFYEFEKLFLYKWSGLQFGAPCEWFDHGRYTIPPHVARGLPYRVDPYRAEKIDFVHDVTIGAAQGIILGVPDGDARWPKWNTDAVTDILRNGFVTRPECYSVFNSQITAFRRELAPACVQFYAEQGRNTDIFASLNMRDDMRNLGWYTHYGLPMGYHNRSVRDLSKDLEAEKWGVANIDMFAKELAKPVDIEDSLVLSDTYKKMHELWMEDCDEAMK